MDPKNVSVIITCRNEAPNIARCLDSVTGFGEILLVDSFSSDQTLEIARSYPVAIYVRPYRSAAAQKNWALSMVKHRWVLILDADEELSEALREEIRGLESDGTDGYWIRRPSSYLGVTIRGCGWQRDKVLRLFDRERGRYGEVEVHEEVSLQGRAGVLSGHLLHHPYRDVHHHLEKINEYSSRGAKNYSDRGGRWAMLNLLLHPPFRFVRMYFLQRGFVDGAQGLLLCLLSAYSVFMKYAKVWEYQGWKRRG
jgi:glycosyltransferase involved in cell wall biosynthesis